MSERTIRFTSAMLATAGAAIAGYLLYVRSTGGTLACVTGGCDTVQHSSYSELFGIPVAALGLAGFLSLFVVALARGEVARLTQATLALAGFFFGVYLLYVQVSVIDAICQWCVASDLLTTAIAALALLRLRAGAVAAPPPAAPARPYPQRRPNGSRGPTRKQRQQARTR
ncbi:MAG TPA: vitamin K epoxide reductase family protein [Gaiellaceae bacterium]|jgi:uncharacterized membrane protein|nr:vitamin K epoxide reductase family protein [Gaiellaceae bacterium]